MDFSVNNNRFIRRIENEPSEKIKSDGGSQTQGENRDYTDAYRALGASSMASFKASQVVGANPSSPTTRPVIETYNDFMNALVEEYFAWVKDTFCQGQVLPKSETAKGLAYSINQEEYLKVFLTDGEVPIDDSASERALRNFTIGRKNWMTINTVRGAQASAIIYSITETARANNLNVYYYIKHLLTELPQLVNINGSIEQSVLEPLMPWSKTLPADCYSKRRN